MSESMQTKINAIIARAPEWVRQELASKEPSTRTRAEESLAAIIAGALQADSDAQ